MDIHEKFKQAVQRRDTLRSKVQRVQGKLEASRETLETIEAESRRRGVEPDELGSTIRQLKTKFEKGVVAFDAELEAAEIQVAPYLEG